MKKTLLRCLCAFLATVLIMNFFMVSNMSLVKATGNSEYICDSATWKSYIGDVNIGGFVGAIDPGDAFKIENVNFESGFSSVSLMIGCPEQRDSVFADIYLDEITANSRIARIMLLSTGGWENFKELTSLLNRFVSGVHTIYVKSSNNAPNFNVKALKLSGEYNPKSYVCGNDWTIAEGGAVNNGMNIGSFTQGSVFKVANVDFGSGYNYVSFSTASPNAGGKMELYLDGTTNKIAGISVSSKDGWNEYSDTDTANLNQRITGKHTVYVKNISGVFNVRAFQFSGSYLKMVEYSCNKTDWKEHIGQVNIGDFIGGIDPGDVFKIENVDFKTGFSSVALKIGCPEQRDNVFAEVYIDGVSSENCIAILAINNTGGWETFQEMSSLLNREITGQHTVYIKSGNGAPNFNVKSLILSGEYDPLRYVCGTNWLVTEGDAVNNGLNIGNFSPNSVFKVANVDFGNGYNYIAFDTAALYSGGKIEVFLDGKTDLIATVSVSSADGWDSYTETEAANLYKRITGKHDIYIKNSNGMFNVRAFRFIEEYTGKATYSSDGSTWKNHTGQVNIGSYVGGIDPGDVFQIENVDFKTGFSEIALKIGCPEHRDDVYADIYIDEISPEKRIARIPVVNTGNWEEFQDISAFINQKVIGVHSVLVESGVNAPNFNVKSLEISGEYDPNQYICGNSWKVTEGNAVNNGMNIGHFEMGCVFKIENVDFATGFNFMTFTTSSDLANGIMEVYLDGLTSSDMIASISLSSADGWDNYAPTESVKLSRLITGKHTIYVKNAAGIYNVKTLRLSGTYVRPLVIVDGEKDSSYSEDKCLMMLEGTKYQVSKNNPYHANAKVYYQWDDENVYFYVEVAQKGNSTNDRIEMFIDTDPSTNPRVGDSWPNVCDIATQNDISPRYYASQDVLGFWGPRKGSQVCTYVKKNNNDFNYVMEICTKRADNEKYFQFSCEIMDDAQKTLSSIGYPDGSGINYYDAYSVNYNSSSENSYWLNRLVKNATWSSKITSLNNGMNAGGSVEWSGWYKGGVLNIDNPNTKPNTAVSGDTSTATTEDLMAIIREAVANSTDKIMLNLYEDNCILNSEMLEYLQSAGKPLQIQIKNRQTEEIDVIWIFESIENTDILFNPTLRPNEDYKVPANRKGKLVLLAQQDILPGKAKLLTKNHDSFTTNMSLGLYSYEISDGNVSLINKKVNITNDLTWVVMNLTTGGDYAVLVEQNKSIAKISPEFSPLKIIISVAGAVVLVAGAVALVLVLKKRKKGGKAS